MHSPHRLTRYLSHFLQAVGMQNGTSRFCYECERFTQWQAQLGFYQCPHCGQDPLEHRPDHNAV